MGVIVHDSEARYKWRERRRDFDAGLRRSLAKPVLTSMRDRMPVIMSLLIGIVAGAGLATAIIMKPQKKAKVEAPIPRFEVICHETPNVLEGYPVVVLRDRLTGQDYLAFRGGLVLLGQGTNRIVYER